jgi:hypothetical protein
MDDHIVLGKSFFLFTMLFFFKKKDIKDAFNSKPPHSKLGWREESEEERG